MQQLERERETARERERRGGGGGTERVDEFMLRIIALSERARVATGSQRFLEYNCGEKDPKVTTDS